MSELSVSTFEKYPTHVVVTALTNIEAAQSMKFYIEIKSSLLPAHKKIVVDISQCKEQDHSILAVLLLVASDLQHKHGYFVGVVGMDKRLIKILESRRYRAITFLSSISMANKYLHREKLT